MEEEECDYSTPIGRKIKRLNALSKKPKLDEELSLALDAFHDKIGKQQIYLKNGIFNINFAEAALFIQSCTDLYGKKVDLLWDQLLEFHTRLIEYDCEHEKEKGNQMNVEVIQRLEERRNRYKRKKKFKLVLSCDDNIDGFLFDKPQHPMGNTFESDDEVYKKWKKLEWQSAKITSIPNAVYKQQRTMYRMKNYYIMKRQNFDVYDTEDGEFNIKYGRIPGWHFIQHIFEYNKKGLLPDKNNVIATLRLGAYLRLAFMRDNKIPLNSEYHVYKDRYLAFKKKFFEEEAKKWQNMPLDTMEDLHKQLQYLAQKERETLEQNNPQRNSNLSPVLSQNLSRVIHCCDDGSEDSKSSDDIDLERLISESDNDSLFELSFNCDGQSKSDLCIRLERLSSDVINTKLRQDSGFFDRVSDSEDDLGRDELTGDGNNNLNKSAEIGTTDESAVLNSCEVCPTITDAIDSSTMPLANVGDSATVPENSITLPVIDDNLLPAMNVSGDKTGFITDPCPENSISDHNKENVDPNVNNGDDFDTRSVVSDHSYCRTPIARKVLEVNNNVLARRNVRAKKDIMSPFVSSLTMIIPRAIRTKVTKEKINKEPKGQENDPSPSKRRKMSQKQLEKLVDKMVVLPTVKENKFEHFFSKNYQPQLGEGEVQEMEYESESEAEDFVEPLPVSNPPPTTEATPQNKPHSDDAQSVFSDHNYSQPAEVQPEDAPPTDPALEADTQSIFSDHNYSQAVNDSGFFDGTIDQSEGASESPDAGAGSGGDTATTENAPAAVVDPREEEYQRLLKALKDSRRSMNEEIEATPEELRTEQLRREQERQESRARVDQWKDTINPILRNLHENDFNIHDYGSAIMDGMEVNERKPFKSIVNGKSSAEVVRYFIASLQLANTYNIEICGAKKGELSNDSYNVQLLKHDRYHEHLTDYQAPSEETLRERLKRVRTMRGEAETAGGESETKKPRLSDTPKRRRPPPKTIPSDVQESSDPSPRREDAGAFLSRIEENDNAQMPRPSRPNRLKGKSILKVVVPRATVEDLTAPSTSRRVHWPDSSDFSCDSNFSATEESFLECLLEQQQLMPGVQLVSSPKAVSD